MERTELFELAKEYGTPTFVFDTEYLRNRMTKIKEIVGENVHLCYSIKANPFLITTMLDCVEKLEVCSPGELRICERLKVDSDKIIYSGVSKREIDVEEALEYGAAVYTAESLGHVKRLNAEAVKRGVQVPIILRLSSGSQFGMSKENLCYAIEHRADYEGVIIEGIHYFVGTQRKKLTEQVKELEMLEALFAELQEKYDYQVKKLEYGPGLPVPYFSNENFEDTLAPLKEIASTLRDMAEKVHLTVEMGRFFVTECGYYITKIVDQKSNGSTNYAIIDGGMNHLNYLGQMMGMKVPVIHHLKQGTDTEKKDWCLCGSLCTTADIVVRQVEFTGLEEMDILVFANTGAYSVTEGIYLFLSRTMPRIVLYNGAGQTVLARDFREIYELNCPV